jgi:glycerol kinase
MLYNIKSRVWDPELLSLLDVPEQCLPAVEKSGSLFGKTKGRPGALPDGIPIHSMLGDQQAALFGQLCVEPGQAKNTYGTGCFLLFNTGSEFVLSRAGLLTTLAVDGNGDVCYALEGSVFIGGAVVQWLRDYMNFFAKASETEAIIKEQLQDETDHVVFVPAFSGLGAPYWDMQARGAIFGLSRDTSPARIIRAGLKSIALQSSDLVEAMQKDTGVAMKSLRVDGGATTNAFLMQYQADILNATVERPANIDTTAVGAAYLAGLQLGVWKDITALRGMETELTRFSPQRPEAWRRQELKYWHRAVERVKGWEDD